MKMIESPNVPPEVHRCKAQILRESADKPPKVCRVVDCGGTDFRRRQYRKRWFLAVISNVVWPFRGLLCCWRCERCGTCMTQYSTLCMPFKRYLRIEIENRALRYTQEERTSYERAACEANRAVSYETEATGAEATEEAKAAETTAHMAGTTVWRWQATVAAMAAKQPAVLKAAQQKMPGRLSAWIIAPWKYRSEKRREILTASRLWLEALRALKQTNEFAMEGLVF